ncbi:MAG: prolyl oligopeptidase family serine peptidase [Lachnospiraceae bacterium]|nr:prolyl oligopeptidase family serine peptidase [Lachnospiraceae bacterium]
MYTKNKWYSDKHFSFHYVEYLPSDYDEENTYPLVFFLHGAGERGEDPDVAMRHGYMKHVREQGAEYPFIFIAPQCPMDKYWGCYTESLIAFLEDMIATHAVDEDRVYLTGLSMGGTGTWMLAMACPEKFAAIAPICGSGICWYGEALKDVPVYAYHGDADEIVPVTESVNMVARVNAGGGNAQVKICYGVGHDAWEEAYKGDELWKWMLAHRRIKTLF